MAEKINPTPQNIMRLQELQVAAHSYGLLDTGASTNEELARLSEADIKIITDDFSRIITQYLIGSK